LTYHLSCWFVEEFGMVPKSLLRDFAPVRALPGLERHPPVPPSDIVRGDGRPVVLVPGFMGSDRSLGVMRRWLDDVGYSALPAQIGRNIRCGEDATEMLLRRVDAVAEAYGRPVALVGHSRGGHLVRAVAVRRPDLVSGVVTLGTPLPELRAAHPILRADALALAGAGSVGIPGLLRFSCFSGACCERYRAELVGPFPASVGCVAMWSRRDACADPRRLLVRDARVVELESTHIGMLVDTPTFRAVSDAVATFGRRRKVRARAAA
jgi:triacylglycerol lipase